MTTDHFATQAPVSFYDPDTKAPHGVASNVFNFYPIHDAWVSTSTDNHLHASEPDYLRFPVPCIDTSLESQLEMSNAMSNTSTMSNSIENVSYSSPSMFETVDAPTHGRNPTAAAPQYILFKVESSSPKSYTNAKFDPNHVQMSANSSPSARDSQNSTTHQSSTSSQTSLNPQSPPKRKRQSGRKSSIEDIEPDSARATYLEKNRKAASKCRSKQKQQQDDRIEQAREIENKNKCLKAEVSMLQGGMRELMDMVGQHNACSDTRLKQYLQRQADRLAAGSSRTPPLLDAQELFPTGHYL